MKRTLPGCSCILLKKQTSCILCKVTFIFRSKLLRSFIYIYTHTHTLTLEQQGFELCRSTFFQSVCTIVLHDPRMAEYKDVRPSRGPTVKLYMDF